MARRSSLLAGAVRDPGPGATRITFTYNAEAREAIRTSATHEKFRYT